MDFFLKKRHVDKTEKRRRITPCLTSNNPAVYKGTAKQGSRDSKPASANTYCDNTVVNSKYTMLTFLPLNLFEQFHRPINLYFLIVAGLQFIPSIAPVSPLSTVGPLLVAFSITAVKEGYDDLQRHRQDRADNARMYRRIRQLTDEEKRRSSNRRGGGLVASSGYEEAVTTVVEDVVSSDIRVGDMLLLGPYDMLPCDAVALMSSNGDGAVYVSTENLDGEADAKEKISALADVWRLDKGFSVCDVRTSLISMEAAAAYATRRLVGLDSEGPNAILSRYNGSALLSDGGVVSVSMDHLLPASSIVRNTTFVIAMAVFTGNETKVGMTKQFPPVKWALLDKQCSHYAKFVFLFQFLIILTLSILGAVVTRRTSEDHWYLYMEGPTKPNTIFFTVILPLRFFLMATLMVPISFKVTIDISKAYISKVIQWDLGMFDPKRKVFAKVKNSSLAEDLGQIEYVFADKTGTLTENSMQFRYLLAKDGTVYSSDDGTLSRLGSNRTCTSGGGATPTALKAAARDEADEKLLYAMLFCNAVEPAAVAISDAKQHLSSEIEHHAQWTSPSPDEVALVEGAAACGALLMDRSRLRAHATLFERDVACDILYSIKFTSHRGCMSVLMKEDHATLESPCAWLLTKGSDERVLPLCTDGDSDGDDAVVYLDRVMIGKRLSDFASKGLRTLTFAYRKVPLDVADAWLSRVRDAECDPETTQRNARLQELYAEMEQSLTFAGATAVEDSLQPRVKETITSLREAGVKVWMLTGDKLETAKQIAATSGLLSTDDLVYDVALEGHTGCDDAENEVSLERKLDELERKCLGAAAASSSASVAVRPDARASTSETTRSASNGGAPRESDAARRRKGNTKQRKRKTTPSDISKEFTRAEELSSAFLEAVAQDLGGTSASSGGEAPTKGLVGNDVISRDASSKSMRSEETLGLLQRGAATADENMEWTMGDSGPAALYSLVVTGAVLGVLQKPRTDPALLERFKTLLLGACCVVCCRTTPDQKALVVQLVKSSGHMTLAVGDGGNDVAMIQEAHVGVGIDGVEGKQAANGADFAVCRFHHLLRLMLVHGHTAFQRSSYIVQQSFYKSMMIAWTQMIFNSKTLLSGVSFYNSFGLMMWNGVFTIPLTFLYVTDSQLQPGTLLSVPALYALSQRARYLNGTTFFAFIARGLLQGTIAFYITCATLSPDIALNDGVTTDYQTQFIAPFGACVTLVGLTVLLESHSFWFLQWLALLSGPSGFILSFFVYSEYFPVLDFYQCFNVITRNAAFYLSGLAVLGACLLPHALFSGLKFWYWPDRLQLQRGFLHRVAKLDQRCELKERFRQENPSSFWRSWWPLGVFGDVTDS